MPKNNETKSGDKSYKDLSDQLNELLLWFESSDMDVDQAIDKYEEAMTLITEMEKYLKTAENRVRKVAARFE